MKFDSDQLSALAAVNEGKNVFLTGPAGSGKSCVTVEAIRRRLRTHGLRVCATTGIAALNLRDMLSTQCGETVNALTIYRWAGIGIGPKDGQSFEDALSYIRKLDRGWRNAVSRIQSTRVLIIDEISMLPGRVLDFIDYVCREVRESTRPFGGIQVIAIGDFLQLPPVSKSGVYDWAFLSETWQALEFVSIHLREIHRQTDLDFIALLNDFREGIVSDASARLLQSRSAPRFPSSQILRLFTHNNQVNHWNDFQLGALPGEEVSLTATLYGPDHETEWLLRNMTTPQELRLKCGARVMVTANIPDLENSGCLLAANGEMGTVLWIQCGMVIVAMDNGRQLDIVEHVWEFDPAIRNGATVKQFPLRLAYACTIHKSQGLTLPSALIDIRAAREPGQAYVALSRVPNIQSLYLRDWFKGIWVSPQAIAFHRSIARGYQPGAKQAAPKLKLT